MSVRHLEQCFAQSEPSLETAGSAPGSQVVPRAGRAQELGPEGTQCPGILTSRNGVCSLTAPQVLSPSPFTRRKGTGYSELKEGHGDLYPGGAGTPLLCHTAQGGQQVAQPEKLVELGLCPLGL